MKKLLMFSIIGLLMPMVTIASQPFQKLEILTDILSIKQNHGFPAESVTLTYIKHCSEKFSNVWVQNVKPGHINLGVSVVHSNEHCLMDQLEWTNETVTIHIHTEVLTKYGFLTELNQAEPFFSGISIDNFN